MTRAAAAMGVRLKRAATLGRRFAVTFIRSGDWALWGILAASYVQVSVLLLVGLDADVIPGGSGVIGTDAVASSITRPSGVGLVVLGLVSVLGCVLLALGHGYAFPVLVLAGTLGTILLATVGTWAAAVVPVAMICGVVLALLTDALDHLFPSSTAGKGT